MYALTLKGNELMFDGGPYTGPFGPYIGLVGPYIGLLGPYTGPVLSDGS